MCLLVFLLGLVGPLGFGVWKFCPRGWDSRWARTVHFTLLSQDGGIKRPLQKMNARLYDVIQLRKKYNSGKGVI